MALVLQNYPGDCVHHARVVCGPAVDAAVFAELEQALSALEAHLATCTATYIALSVVVAGAAAQPFYAERIPEATVDEFVPYAEFSPAFWDRALADPALRPHLGEFLARLEAFAEHATREDGGIWYLCEGDEVLFAQPILFYLACSDIAFVPHYTRMLAHWRTEESAHWCAHDVMEIAEHHGLCPVTMALVESYIANDGPYADEFAAALAGTD